MLGSRRHRRAMAEGGQALILAMVFVAVLALIAGAILNLGDATALQHVRAENTAATDSPPEGGAAYAGADANRPDLAPIDCVPGNGGTLTMADSSHTVVQYLINACNPGGTVPGLTGTPCTLCVLNQAGNRAYDPAFIALTDDLTLCVNGDIDINGSAKGGTIETTNSNTSCSPANPPYINVLKNSSGTAGCAGCAPTFSYFGSTFTDPLALGAGGQKTPQAGIDVPSTGTCSAATPCVMSNVATLSPGVYSSISESGPFTMQPGVYVIEGSFSITGNGVTGTQMAPETGITLYLACSTFPSRCPGNLSGVTTGTLGFSGNGASYMEAPCGSHDTTPCMGERANFAGMMVLGDPNLTGGALTDVGNGDSFGGTVDIPAGDISIQGGGNGTGGAVDITGRLIANTVTSKTNKGHIGTGLKLTGSGRPNPVCAVFDDAVGPSPLPAPSSRARAIVEEVCAGSSVAAGALVYFNYSP